MRWVCIQSSREKESCPKEYYRTYNTIVFYGVSIVVPWVYTIYNSCHVCYSVGIKKMKVRRKQVKSR